MSKYPTKASECLHIRFQALILITPTPYPSCLPLLSPTHHPGEFLVPSSLRGDPLGTPRTLILPRYSMCGDHLSAWRLQSAMCAPPQHTSFNVTLPFPPSHPCMSPLHQGSLWPNSFLPTLLTALDGFWFVPGVVLPPNLAVLSSSGLHPILGHGQKWGQSWKIKSSWGCVEGRKPQEPELWWPGLEEVADTEREATGHVPKDNTGVPLRRVRGCRDLQRGSFSFHSAPGIQKFHQQFPNSPLPEQHETTVGLGGLIQH